jgi:uncharacterized protein (TIGR02266 family)
LIANDNLQSASLDKLTQIWKRLLVEPMDPAGLIDRSYIPKAQQWSEDSRDLFGRLAELLTQRAKLHESWNAHIEEMSYRMHLMGVLAEHIEDMEEMARYQQETIAVVQQTEKDKASDNELIELFDGYALPNSPTQDDMPASLCNQATVKTIETRAVPAAMTKEFDRETPRAIKPPPLPTSPENKRVFPRIDLGTAVNFRENNHAFYTGYTENISSGGLFIATFDIRPKIGQRFVVELTLPSQRPIEALCEVAWYREYNDNVPDVSPGFGCRMMELDENDQLAIDQFIACAGSMFMPPKD